MDMLKTDQIAEAGLTDWRKLGQGLHARFLLDDFTGGAHFVSAIATAGDAAGHHPRVTLGAGYADLRLVSDDAIYRDDEGAEHVVEWVTQRDVDLARRISEIATELGVRSDPASITTIELALDTANAAGIAPMWAALLTGSTDAHGRGTIGDDVRDHTGGRRRSDRSRRRRGRDDRGRQPGAVVHRDRRPGRQPGLRVHLTPASGVTLSPAPAGRSPTTAPA
jgi:4a-hydroxytetrahydrobiopterin dehydratase